MTRSHQAPKCARDPSGVGTPRALALAVFLSLGIAHGLALPAGAQPPAEVDHDAFTDQPGVPVLPAGREHVVLALLAPSGPSDTLPDGYRFGDVRLDRHEVRIELLSDHGNGTVRLVTLELASDSAVAARNFAIDFEPAGLPRGLRDSVVRRIRANERDALFAAPSVAAPRARSAGQERPFPFQPRGGFLLFAALAFWVVAVSRSLAEAGSKTALGLLAITVLGAAFRYGLGLQNQMTAWPYGRVVPAVVWLLGSDPVRWLGRVARADVPMTDVIFGVNAVLACATVPAIFVHARSLFRSDRIAILAALLLATNPQHVRFSRSDVEFIQSLLGCSLTFSAIYGALRAEARWYRFVCFVAIPPICLFTYLARPENGLLLAIDVGAISLAFGRGDVPRPRALAALLVVLASGGYATVTFLLGGYSSQISEGLSLTTLIQAFRGFFSFRWNAMGNPWVTPPWLPALALWGARALSRSGAMTTAGFLVAWFVLSFAVQAIVLPERVVIQARYHLHLLTPVVLLAAYGAEKALERFPRSSRPAIALVLIGPLLYASFVRDVGYREMMEFTFLRRHLADVPNGCTVIEYRGALDPHQGGRLFDSVGARFATSVTDGLVRRRFDVMPLDRFDPTLGREVVRPAARAALEAPGRCTYLLLDLRCAAQRPVDTREAPACTEARSIGRSTVVAAESQRAETYDPQIVGYWDERTRGDRAAMLPADRPVRIELRRMLPP